MIWKYKYFILFILLFFAAACGKAQTRHKRHIPPDRNDTKPEIHLVKRHQHPALSKKRQIVVNHAVKAIGLPYKWGGKSPSTGFDCSGLVLYTHKQAGLHLPRMARDQYRKGRPIPHKNLLPGDLVFFKDIKAYKTIHVGIYEGNGFFIHSPGKGRNVRRVKMSNSYFQKHFIGAKTYL